MEPEGSLPHTQKPATCLYPEPDKSCPCPFPFLKIRFNNILPSLPGFSKCSPSLRCPHQNPVCTSRLPHTCYMPRPSHSFWFDHQNDIWWGVQIIKLLVMYSSPFLCYLVPLRPKYPFQNPSLQHNQPTCLPHCEQQSFIPTQNNIHNYSSSYLNHYMYRWRKGGNKCVQKLSMGKCCGRWHLLDRDMDGRKII